MDLSEVEWGDADEDRVERLQSRTTFDRDQAEAVVRFAKVDRSNRDPDNIRSFVGDDEADDVVDGLTESECADIRRRMSDAHRPTDVVGEYPNKHPSVVFRHATGKCDHDTDVDATVSPRISRDECRDLREDFQSGDTVDDLRTDYHRSVNAVTRHVFGRCDHDFPNDYGRGELSKSSCGNMRRAYRENESATVVDVARAFMVAEGTTHRHLSGACGHGDGVEAPVGGDAPEPIDADECDRLRARYGAGSSVPDVADDADRDESAVRRHVFGRCRHDGAGYEPDTDRVSPDLCEALRFEYRNRGVESVSSVIDRHDGLTKGTFYYHVFGDCSHDVDTEPANRTDTKR